MPTFVADAETRAYCERRFAEEPDWRRRFKVATSNPSDPSYQAGLERYVAVEAKCRADQTRRTPEPAEHGDKVHALLANKSIIDAA